MYARAPSTARCRRVLVIIVSLTMTAGAAGVANAVTKDGVKLRSPISDVRLDDPFVWTGKQGKVELTATIKTAADGVASATFVFRNLVTGAKQVVKARSAMNPDGSVSVAAGPESAPKSHIYNYPAGTLPSLGMPADAVCTKCGTVAGLAAAGAAIACIFTAGWGCVAAWGLGTAAAAGYCSTNPCGGGNPSCSNTSYAGPYNDPYAPGYNLQVNGTVSCSDTMEWISMTLQVYRYGSLYDTWRAPDCFNNRSCGWSLFYGAAPGCYQNKMTWTGSFWNKATQQHLQYGNPSGVWSGTACV